MSIYMFFYNIFKMLLLKLVEANYSTFLTSIRMLVQRYRVGNDGLLLGLDLYHVFGVEGTHFYIIIYALVRQLM